MQTTLHPRVPLILPGKELLPMNTVRADYSTCAHPVPCCASWYSAGAGLQPACASSSVKLAGKIDSRLVTWTAAPLAASSLARCSPGAVHICTAGNWS